MMEKMDFFSVQLQAVTSKRKPKNQSASRNNKARAKTSKSKPKHQSMSQNVKAWAKMSKRKPKQSTSKSGEMGAKPVKCKLKQGHAQTVEMWA